MGRPAEIERHDRRLEIDFAIANRVPWQALADAFGCHEQTFRRYRSRMVAEQPGYFDKLRLQSLSRGPRGSILRHAKVFADRHRKHWLAEADSAFHPRTRN